MTASTCATASADASTLLSQECLFGHALSPAKDDRHRAHSVEGSCERQFLERTDLEQLVNEHGPPPPGRVVHVLSQVCGALAETHDLGLVHRDGKPAPTRRGGIEARGVSLVRAAGLGLYSRDMAVRDKNANGNISARMTLRVLAYAAARGHDPDAICGSVGVSLPALKEEGARVPYVVAEKWGDRAVELTQDPNMGLHLAQDVSPTRARSITPSSVGRVRPRNDTERRRRRRVTTGNRNAVGTALSFSAKALFLHATAKPNWRGADRMPLVLHAMGFSAAALAVVLGDRAIWRSEPLR